MGQAKAEPGLSRPAQERYQVGGFVEPAGQLACGGGQFVGVVVAGAAERGRQVCGSESFSRALIWRQAGCLRQPECPLQEVKLVQ